MQVDKRILVTLTSRLYADEISKLQERVGSIVPLQDPHKLQNLNSVGLAPVCSRNTNPDYIKIYHYLSNSTLAILDEVTPDTLVFTRIDHVETYQLKNVYKPFFQWDSHTQLSVIPPMFGLEEATVKLDSNQFDMIFPTVVPRDLGQNMLQKLLLYSIYSKLHEINPDEVNMPDVQFYTTNISHMGRTYNLDIINTNPESILSLLDNVCMATCLLTALTPIGCYRLGPALLRYNQHELLQMFLGVIPEHVHDAHQDVPIANVGDDVVRMEAFFTYLQSLGSIFNLAPKFHLSIYSPDTLLGTGWLAY
ncbi:capsid protein [Harp seal herpesvirus]|uniref:Capsid protein n=1 Tax=phocid gammaherpesvirus 3 TaxID=2560643 RepID=A0A0R5XSV3_9GAMA|nr:capsid protein [Harp seal herpesvirus]AJG42952.1 capsid protein [Harp seal herpesvirus]